LAGGVSGQPPTGTVWRGVEGVRVPLTGNDVAGCAHRAGDEARLAHGRLDRTLARDPDVPAEMVLLLRKVVVTVDPLDLLELLTDPVRETADDAVHHLLAVKQRELLRPQQVSDVRIELVGALLEIGEVFVRQ